MAEKKIGLSKYFKFKALFLLPFLKKMRLVFAQLGLFLAGNRARSQVKRSESKFDKSYFIQTIRGQLPVKKFGFHTFQFCGYKSQKHFRTILTWIFKFGCFSRYHAYIVTPIKIRTFDYLKQNLILNRLATISNSKSKNQKVRMHFSNRTFSF